jgi:hypothetical protein
MDLGLWHSDLGHWNCKRASSSVLLWPRWTRRLAQCLLKQTVLLTGPAASSSTSAPTYPPVSGHCQHRLLETTVTGPSFGLISTRHGGPLRVAQACTPRGAFIPCLDLLPASHVLMVLTVHAHCDHPSAHKLVTHHHGVGSCTPAAAPQASALPPPMGGDGG